MAAELTLKPVRAKPSPQLASTECQLVDRYIDAVWMERGLSQNSLQAYRRDLVDLATFLAARQQSLAEATAADLEARLAAMASANASPRSQARWLSSVKGFYRYCLRERLRNSDPSLQLSPPRLPRQLPQTLTEQQVEALLGAPRADHPVEQRDRAMLELLYATGLRVSELVNLELSAVNFRQGVVRVTGKGNKERLVPAGEQALAQLEAYLRDTRPELLSRTGAAAASALFLSNRGQAMSRQAFWYRIKIYAKRIGLTSTLSPHGLRHAFATHLLNHGADLRVVQLLLFFNDTATTEIYTHVARARLQALHAEHHPRG